MLQIHISPTFEAWRERARACLQQNLRPETTLWVGQAAAPGGDPQGVLFVSREVPPASQQPLSISASFLRDARYVAAHENANRWDLLYRIVWRLTHGETRLFRDAVDDDVRQFTRYLAQVRRDIHKCHAFVRFRQVEDRYVAWYRPDHLILYLAAGHFVRRYGAMLWSIYSERESVHWDGQRLMSGAGCPAHAMPGKDTLEDLWRTYYAAVFNPARLKVKAMRQEMPRRYWSVLPESRLIDGLIAETPRRLEHFARHQPASVTPLVPAGSAPLAAVAAAVHGCRVCPWSQQATHTVFGVGPCPAPLALVGEQPGDQEDLQGMPFVGPAGELLDEALAMAGIERQATYITNAVKHFKWAPRGKKRIHQRPAAGDIATCKPWLAAEMARVRPEVLVCLGAVSAQAVLGRAVKLQEVRGRPIPTPLCPQTLITTHPAAILRADASLRQQSLAQLVQDLVQAAGLLRRQM